EVSQLYYTGFIPFCVYTRYFTLPSSRTVGIYLSITAKGIVIFLETPANSIADKNSPTFVVLSISTENMHTG
ncbi:hypothetical protein, partial [Streptococcus agalactiae]|uniref:hypothetical protein n=1 Tax=Streptococcus agalactiae TaxID=1311 RepID=UPI003FA72753